MVTVPSDARPAAATKPLGPQLRLLGVFRDISVPLVGGILLGLSFRSEQLSWLAWIALVPTAWVLFKPQVTVSHCVGIFYGGLAFHLLGLEWMRESYHGALIDTWVILGHFLSVIWIAAIWAGRRMMGASRLPALVLLPVFWVAMESVRWYVAGIPVQDGFPLLQLGTTQVEHDRLIQIADLGGIAAVSFLVAANNGALFDFLNAAFRFRRHGPSTRWLAISPCLAGAMTLSALLYGEWRLQDTPKRGGPLVGIVSGWFDSRQTAADIEQLRRSLLSSLNSHRKGTTNSAARHAYPDLLVWKEDAVFDVSFVVPKAASDESGSGALATSLSDAPSSQFCASAAGLTRLGAIARQVDCSLLIGCVRHQYAGPDVCRYNSLMYVNENSGNIAYYDKVHLAPWTEFHPRIAEALGILPSTNATSAYEAPMRPGHGRGVFELPETLECGRFATAICYDVFFPEPHRRTLRDKNRNARPAFFVAATNEYMARDSVLPRQSFVLQRFRAIECRRSYVRNAEGGISAIVDGSGRPVPLVRAQYGNDGRNVLIGEVPIDHRTSIYVFLGEWLSIGACAAAGLMLVVSLTRRRGSPGSAEGRQ